MRLDHSAAFIKHVDDSAIRARVALPIIDGGIGFVKPQPTEWHYVGNQINAPMIFAGRTSWVFIYLVFAW